ncbi:MAG: hypothetical protein GTN71_08415, partial [Anaerolineae bacterium]|nr:hypothetical protein [Anaerolineae bacterium]
SLMVAIPPADPQAQPTQHTTIWHIPTDGTPASLVTNIAAFPEGEVAFSHELNYVAYVEVPQSGIIPTERTQIWLKVMRLENGDWASYLYYGGLYGWAPNSRRFAFVADTGHQMPQLRIGQWSGGTIPSSVDAGTPVSDVRWVDADHYLFVVRRDPELGADGDSFDILLGDIDGSSTVLATMADFPAYDFASESTLTLTPAKTPTVPTRSTQETASRQTTPVLPTNTPALPPPNTPSPTETPANPQILSFEVTPTWSDPGDTVTLTWEARGDRATICPSARFVLFTSDDCQPVPLSGTTTFTIPLEATGFHFIDFL